MSAPTLFDYSDRFPHAPGFKERGGASEAAAKQIKPAARTLQDRVLATIKSRAMTADEAARELGEDILAVRPRVSELFRRGLIEKTTDRRSNKSGCRATVWKVRSP